MGKNKTKTIAAKIVIIGQGIRKFIFKLILIFEVKSSKNYWYI